MKKIFLSFFFIISFFSLTFNKVLASEAFVVYPSFNFVEQNKTYEIFIENKSNAQKEYIIEPILLYLDNENKNLKEVEDNIELNLQEYLQLNIPLIQIESNSKKSFKANYLKDFEGYTLGISITEKLVNEKNISLGKKIVSVFYNKNLSPEDQNNLDSQLVLEPSLKLANYSLSNSINTQTIVDNLSSKIIFPTGKIEIYADNKILGSISLTSEINKSVFPKNNITVSETFYDERPFWERIGEVEYKQVIKIDDVTLIDTQKIYNLPFELVVLVLGILLILFLVIIKTFLRKTRKKK